MVRNGFVRLKLVLCGQKWPVGILFSGIHDVTYSVLVKVKCKHFGDIPSVRALRQMHQF